jgi:hypothetical protein
MNRVRLAFCVLVLCGLSVTGSAQEERAIPVVTSAAPVEKIRFAASPSAIQMRIEVWSAGGALVYDSDWKDGNILDWLPQDSSGQPLASGTYRLVMRSKNLAGQTSEKETSLRMDSGGMAIQDQPGASPKITLTAHDGQTGQLITTSGDLSFRFGDFLNRKETEAMRLTKEGNLGIGTEKPQAPLDVNGLIRTSEGIMFPDGTILTTAMGLPGVLQNVGTIRQRPGALRSLPPSVIGPLTPSSSATAGRSPKPNAGPDYQFKVDSGGVHIGTTPAFGLDVAGNVTLTSNLALPMTSSASAGVIMLGDASFAHNFTPNVGSDGSNTFVGRAAGNFTMLGAHNTGVGLQALTNLVGSLGGPGNDNTAVGSLALASTTRGYANTAIGRVSLINNTTGAGNIAVGAGAGSNLTTGGNNIDIGNAGVVGESATIRIGTVGTQTMTFIAGINGVTTGSATGNAVFVDANGQLGTTLSSRRYKYDIADMRSTTDDLMSLRPVTFRYLAHGNDAPIQYGLIAEEVAEVYPELVTRNKDGKVESVMYQFLAPMLLNEVQKQHRHIEDQQKTIDALNTRLERLMQRVGQLEGKRTASQ